MGWLLTDCSTELLRVQDKVKEAKKEQDVAMTRQSLEKIHFDQLKSPFAKTVIRDAYLTYRCCGHLSMCSPRWIVDKASFSLTLLWVVMRCCSNNYTFADGTFLSPGHPNRHGNPTRSPCKMQTQKVLDAMEKKK